MAPPKYQHFQASEGTNTARRKHRKSRTGCYDCKRRHVKCDETRPICVNCSVAGRGCSYLDSLLAWPELALTARNPALVGTSPPVSLDDSSDGGGGPRSTTSTQPSASDLGEAVIRSRSRKVALPDDGQFFTLDHFGLFHHAQTDMLACDAADIFFEIFARKRLELCITTPYLMDVLLALASLHRSGLEHTRADYHRCQATRLQTRGLVLFNKINKDVTEDTCVPMALFSFTVGQLVLWSTVRNHRDDFGVFLDHFATYMNLHRGVGFLASSSWKAVKDSELKMFVDFIESGHIDGSLFPTGECDALYQMLEETAVADSPWFEAYRDATTTLQQAFQLYHYASSVGRRGFSAPISFAVRVNDAYIDALRQRQHPALIILAHYAVLLYWCRDLWIYADAGLFMIRAITEYVGEEWPDFILLRDTIIISQGGTPSSNGNY